MVDHWWAKCGHPADEMLKGVEPGAWHPSLSPEFSDLVPCQGATARQTVESELGLVAPFPRPRATGVSGRPP